MLTEFNLILTYLNIYIFIHVGMYGCVCLPHMCQCLHKPEEGIAELGIEIVNACEPHVGAENRLQSSIRADGALTHRAIVSVALYVFFINTQL